MKEKTLIMELNDIANESVLNIDNDSAIDSLGSSKEFNHNSLKWPAK